MPARPYSGLPSREVAFMSTAIGLVRAGLGATLLPSSAAELRAAKDLVVRDLDVPRINRQLGILKQRRKAYSPAAEVLVMEMAALARRGAAGTAMPRAAKAPRRKP